MKRTPRVSPPRGTTLSMWLIWLREGSILPTQETASIFRALVCVAVLAAGISAVPVQAGTCQPVAPLPSAAAGAFPTCPTAGSRAPAAPAPATAGSRAPAAPAPGPGPAPVPVPDPTSPSPPALGSAAPERAFRDALGHVVRWQIPPSRIVSLSPNLTEILFAIGCGGDAVVGVTSYCNFPPQVTALARVGGVADPSLEAVAALAPDLVLATRGNPLEFMESVVRLEIPVYAVEARGGLDRILDLITEIGNVTGRSQGAAHLADSLRQRLDHVRARTRSLPPERRPRVYMGELEGSRWAAGPGSYIQDIIEAAGGENVASSAPADWSPLSLEAIVARQPQVWLGAYGPTSGGDEATVRARAMEIFRTHEGWRDTPLGRDPRLLLIDEDRLQRPGPRVYTVLEELARFLHPELWPPDEGGLAR